MTHRLISIGSTPFACEKNLFFAGAVFLCPKKNAFPLQISQTFRYSLTARISAVGQKRLGRSGQIDSATEHG